MSTEIVINTWKDIQAIKNFKEVAGVILFRKIFDTAPAAQYMFSFGEKFPLGAEEMYADPEFLRHASNVVNAVDRAVSMLGRSVRPLVAILKAMGGRHHGYGVLPAHYPIVGDALIGTLSDALGEKFTDEVKAAWVEIYGVISSAMLEGHDAAEAKVKAEEAKAMGDTKLSGESN
eukprot:CAMPEP_0118702284 /NCGR_PEP_ID=MMETSP0800-20121206/17795_1 /TAXON_ID=210618 ORGANISM="Striatella unipunctata, Strain CCMP2910" /NCGR_SAMPLE_ID=MMETSP0800 /ASSEMBLY_ACC=CAM_ASM_000638 /LENGTH=174 /DNA_ID=CAMNT_0006603447 /DNA_START=66 /DNA_END=590 /DNA_ORIENTATION=+